MKQSDKDPRRSGKAVDRAGVGQTDEEKGIAPEAVQRQIRKELEKEGKAKRRPTFNGGDDDQEQPLQLDK